MTPEQYTALVEKLEKAEVDITRSALYQRGTKKKADCTTLFKAEGVTESEFLAEFGKRVDEKAKTAAANYKAPQSFQSEYQWRTVVHPSLTELPRVSESDRKIFGRISFAVDRINNVVMLCVNTRGHEYKALPLTSSKSADTSSLSVILAGTESVSGKFPNYYDELQSVTTLPFKHAVEQFRRHSIKGVDDFVKFISEHYPCSMLAVAYLKVMLESVKTTIVDKDGKEKETIILVPRSAVVAMGESTQSYDPVRHLIDHSAMLSADPHFIIPMPSTISNDPEEPTFKYVDLDAIVEHGDTPAWDELCLRYTEDEAKVLYAYIYSIFVAKNRSRQLLYIHDPLGYGGKSVTLNAIVSEIGDDQVGVLQKDSLSNQFGLAKIWNKHLVLIPDNKNPNLIRSEKMHMALGGDQAEIEYKGANSFFARLHMKVIACGNTALDIDTAATHERSRVIVIRPKLTDDVLKKIAKCDKNGDLVYDQFGRVKLKGDPDFEQRLKSEFRKMLGKAKKCYEELCPTDGDLILPDSVIQNIEECNDDTFDTMDKFIESTLEFDPESYVRPNDLRETFISDFGNSKDFSFKDFTEHLLKAHGIAKKYSRKADAEDGIRNPVYVGIKLKSA